MKPRIQWVVQPDDGPDVAAILEAIGTRGADVRGRVFVNGRPARAQDAVYEGDYLELWPERPRPPDGEVRIVAQRDGVLVAYKPAGIPTETTQLGQVSAKSALLERLSGGKLHAASRLDTAVSGLLLFALGRDAARRIQRWRERDRIERSYIAIADGLPQQPGPWRWPLAKTRDRGGRTRAVTAAAGAKPSVTHPRVMAAIGDRACLLLLKPQTGRLHQLRAHAALAGCPLLGDRLYRGPGEVCDADGRVQRLDRVALHAIALQLPALDAYAPPPENMAQLWRTLGGSEDDWRRTEPRGLAP